MTGEFSEEIPPGAFSKALKSIRGTSADRETALRMALGSCDEGASLNQIIDRAKAFADYLVPPPSPTTVNIANEQGAEPQGVNIRPFTLSTAPFSPLTPEDAISRLGEESRSIIRRALTEALQLGQSAIAPEHILLAIIRHGDGNAAAALIDMAGTGKAARRAVIGRIAHEPKK